MKLRGSFYVQHRPAPSLLLQAKIERDAIVMTIGATHIPRQFRCTDGRACLYIADLGTSVDVHYTNEPDATYHRYLTTEPGFRQLWLSEPQEDYEWSWCIAREWLAKASYAPRYPQPG